MANCRFCGQSAGFLRKQHRQCRDQHAAGIQQMADLSAQAAGAADFNEATLRTALNSVAQRSYGTEDDVSAAIAAALDTG